MSLEVVETYIKTKKPRISIEKEEIRKKVKEKSNPTNKEIVEMLEIIIELLTK